MLHCNDGEHHGKTNRTKSIISQKRHEKTKTQLEHHHDITKDNIFSLRILREVVGSRRQEKDGKYDLEKAQKDTGCSSIGLGRVQWYTYFSEWYHWSRFGHHSFFLELLR